MTLTVDKDAFTVVDNEGEKRMDGSRFLISVGLGQPDARTRTLTGKENIIFALHGKGEPQGD